MGDHFWREHQTDLLRGCGVTTPIWTWAINHTSNMCISQRHTA